MTRHEDYKPFTPEELAHGGTVKFTARDLAPIHTYIGRLMATLVHQDSIAYDAIIRLTRERDEARRVAKVLASHEYYTEEHIAAANTALAYPEVKP